MERLYRERCSGFTVKHFLEHLVKDHSFGWGYTWTKLHLQWAALVAKAPHKGGASAQAGTAAFAGDDAASRGLATRMAEGEAPLRFVVLVVLELGLA